MRATGSTIAAAAAAVAIVCGGVTALGLHEKEWVPPLQLIGHDPRILTLTEQPGDLYAVGYGGTVRYLAPENCFVLDDTSTLPSSAVPQDSPTPYPTITGGLHGLIWPYGSRPVIQGDRHGVSVPDVGIVWEGDSVFGGGDTGYGDRIGKLFPSLAPRCWTTFVTLAKIDRAPHH